jgi:AraC-like DNA-binding protein
MPMPRLEPSSPTAPRAAPTGRISHPPRQRLLRHPHETPFAAVVLSGGYVEAGDTGRHAMKPGDVLLHGPWESHLDRFSRRGAEVLVLPIYDQDAGAIVGCVADPDSHARTAERDPADAARQLLADLRPRTATAADWPDLLASALTADPNLCLGDWARSHGLHIGSLSRGFRQVFDVTPAGFRLVQRTRRALDAVRRTDAPLFQIAYDCGFADQAHMNRAIRSVARTTPTGLRRSLAPRADSPRPLPARRFGPDVGPAPAEA